SLRTATRGPTGPKRATGVGPNKASVGVPAAAARCVGPVSAPTKSAARAARRAEEAGVVGGARTRGREREDENFLERVISASARLSSPGPQRSTGGIPCAPSHSANATTSPAPHSLFTFEEKGCSTAKGLALFCSSHASTTGF